MRQRIALVTAVCLLLTGAPALAGLYYEATTTIEPGQGKGQRMVAHAWIDGEKGKILFADSDNPLLGEDSYLLTSDGAKTIYMVDPEEKTYMEWDLQAMLGALGGVMQGLGPMLKMDVSNPDVQKLAEGPGPSLHGYSTKHYRYKSAYDMTIKVMGMGNRSHVETVTDTWTTTALTDPAFGAWLRKEPSPTGIEAIDNLISAQMAQQIDGVPLKQVMVSTTTPEKRGKPNTSTTTMEVTLIREEAVAAGTFELPSGYTRTEMPTLPVGQQ